MLGVLREGESSSGVESRREPKFELRKKRESGSASPIEGEKPEHAIHGRTPTEMSSRRAAVQGGERTILFPLQ